jgi:putative chitinase
MGSDQQKINCIMLLKKGSTGEDVKALQRFLGLADDGSFGPGTEAAVKTWQEKQGLVADGIVGNATYERMGLGSVHIAEAATPSVPVAAGNVNLAKLKGHVPDAVIAQIPDVMTKFGIDTALKLAHFLSQCGHESGGFKVVNENLNYSADGLVKIFGKYFNASTAPGYARQPEKIANKVYSSRMGNGNEASGDGWKFRGRGYIQLTGRDNYTAFGKAIGVDIPANPDAVATTYPLLSAAWFFSKNCLKKCADASDATVTAVTKSVNGGTIGLADRLKHFKEYYQALS